MVGIIAAVYYPVGRWDRNPLICCPGVVAHKKKAEAILWENRFRRLVPGTGATEVAPVHSPKFHREAPAEAIDPDIAATSKYFAPTQEGGFAPVSRKTSAVGGTSLNSYSTVRDDRG